MIGAKDVDVMLDLSRVPPKCDMSRNVVCSPPVRISAGVTFHRLAFLPSSSAFGVSIPD